MKAGLVLLVLGLLPALAWADDGAAPAKFKITTKRKDDSGEVRADREKTLFIIKSPFGISQAVIERVDDKWPGTKVLRLHLKGLENFRATSGKVTLNAAVSVQDGKSKVRLWKDGKEDAPLDEKSPFWMDVRIPTSDDKPATELPLKDGYFEMALPKRFLRGQSEVDHPELDRLLQELTETQ